jgi:GTP cyclohydrolase II
MKVTKIAEADFPTRFGHFRIVGFEGAPDRYGKPKEYVALCLGEITTQPALCRVHSQCLTGDVFHSLRCDCGLQLESALQLIGEAKAGILIYDGQEGRGIGLLNKLRAYQLQDDGADTVEANLQLGFDADEREYESAAQILQLLGVAEVRLISNNPAKIEGLEKEGIRVVERVPCIVETAAEFERYLSVKKEKMGHLLG